MKLGSIIFLSTSYNFLLIASITMLTIVDITKHDKIISPALCENNLYHNLYINTLSIADLFIMKT